MPENLVNAFIHGLTVGGLIGIVVVLALTKIDQRAFSEDEVAEAAGVAITAEIPPIEELAEPDYQPTAEFQPPLMREAMRGLVSSLNLSRDGENQHKVILCCSSIPDEGKSTVALNLALYLEKSGFNTLLVDADLRRGCIGEIFGLEAMHRGLAEGLGSGSNGWRLGIHAFPNRRLSVLPRGNASNEAIDLLPRALSPELFLELKTHYDAIILDSSPLIPVSDTISFLQYADHVLLISRMKVSKLNLLRKTVAIIRKYSQHNVRLIANDLKSDPHLYDYGYHEQESTGATGREAASTGPAV